MRAADELTQKEFAKRLGISTRAVRNLHAHGIPRLESRRYPWPEARDWYVKFKQDEVDRRRGGIKEAKAQADLRKTVAQAATAEFELAILRGEYVHVDDIEAELAGPMSELRGKLLALAGRLAPLLDRYEVTEAIAILEPVIAEAMDEMSRIRWSDDENGD